ncbi:MAG: hypothetical protein QOH96_2434, partial [Blastocatellia bacterium]|nr:hypothetical protein [Blastocatellia bacterium]
LEARGQRLEASEKMLDVRCWMLDVGKSKMLSVRCQREDVGC